MKRFLSFRWTLLALALVAMVGGAYVAHNYAAAAEDGRIVQIATQLGARAETDFGLMMVRRLTHTGSTLRGRSISFKASVAAVVQAKAFGLLSARKIAPVIDSTFPMVDAAGAHRRLEASQHIGKIILTIGD